MPLSKRLSQTLFAVLLSIAAQAQVFPPGISYQAVMRDINGEELSNTSVSVDFTIRKNTMDGQVVFEESHHLVATNQFGLFTVIIGNGVNTGTGIFNSLVEIDWGNDHYFLEVRAIIPGQGNPQVLGVSQLLAVPYAHYAAKADSVINEADGDPENELIEDISLDGLVLSIVENGQENSVDLGPVGYATWNKNVGVVYNLNEKIGIATATPQSSLSVNGSIAAKVLKISGEQFIMNSLNADIHVIICDVTSNNIHVNLIEASSCSGRIYKLRKFFSGANTSNNVQLTPATGEFIDGLSSFSMDHSLAEYITIVSDGIGWYLIDHSKE